jgi:hypothetical protein
MSCVKSRKDFKQTSTKRSMASQCSFCFEIPGSITLPLVFNGMDIKSGSQQLPPSIRIIQPALKKSSVSSHRSTPRVCDVAYYIEARLFLKGHLVCEASREIILMPVAVMPPPIEPGDLKNEYRLFTSSELGISWRRKHGLMVSISSSEPRPLSFSIPSAKDEILSTELVLAFSARPMLSDNETENLARPEVTECNLAITLEATTYFLRREEESVLSVVEARDTPFSVVKTAKFKSQRMKIRLLNWDRAKSTTCRSTPTKKTRSHLEMQTNFTQLMSS